MEVTALQEYGIAGGIIIVMVVLFRQIVLWIMQRVDCKDKALDERHEQLMQMTTKAIEFIAESTRVQQQLAQQVEDMGREICSRLDRIESRV